jgi:hypothetical protein
MGLKDEGYPARDYSNHRKKIAVKLYEGDLLFDDSSFDEFGRMTHSWKTEEPMHIGQYVVLHEDSNPRDIIVQPAEKASEAIGKIIINPKLKSGMGWTEDEQNVLPRENKEWGEYTPRGATVEFFGYALDELKVKAENAKITAGDYLDAEDGEEFEKSTDATRWVALATVEALRAGFVPALELQP